MILHALKTFADRKATTISHKATHYKTDTMQYRINLVVLTHSDSNTDFFTHIQQLEKPSSGKILSNILQMNWLRSMDENHLVFLAKPVISTASRKKRSFVTDS